MIAHVGLTCMPQSLNAKESPVIVACTVETSGACHRSVQGHIAGCTYCQEQAFTGAVSVKDECIEHQVQ